MDKSPEAFRTITEVAEWLDTPAHVLRFWESRFSQIKPVKRAGGRRYYRSADMLLLGGIKKLLHDDGTTIKAVQSLLREKSVKHVQSLSQPVNVKVSVKKKSQVAAQRPAAPLRLTDPVIDPMAERPAMAIQKPIKQPEPSLTTEDDQESFDLSYTASTGEAALTIIKLPETLKDASEISHKDLQDIEALYYSLKMVRNNMKRTGAGR